MKELKKDLVKIYSNLETPKASPHEYQKILAKIRSSAPTKKDTLSFSLVFATLLIAVTLFSPIQNQVELNEQNSQMFMYNFSDAFDPN